MIAIAEPFWAFNAAQISILVTMLGGFIVWFSRFEGRVGATVSGLALLSVQTEKLAARMDQIDRDGTRKSQQAIATEEKLMDINSKRLDKLEAMTFELAPKVAAMAKDVEWIADKVRRNGNAVS